MNQINFLSETLIEKSHVILFVISYQTLFVRRYLRTFYYFWMTTEMKIDRQFPRMLCLHVFSSMFEACFSNVSRVFQVCFKNVSRVFLADERFRVRRHGERSRVR